MTVLSVLCFACLAQTPASDPDRLEIGRRGTAVVQPGQIVDLRAYRVCTLADVVHTAGAGRFLYLGEQHATVAHQAMEAEAVRALDATGSQVIVGVEMFTRPKQDVLDQWSAGALAEPQFLEQSDWKGQWGFDYAFYRPLFDAVKDRHLPLVALNVPRNWVHQVGLGGLSALPTSAKLQLPPDLFLGNKDHRQIFESLMGSHPMTGINFENIYSAQVLWDEGMADTALKYLERSRKSDKSVFVVVAGAGHVMYGQGINYRIERRHGGRGITFVMLQSDKPVEVSRGLADFVYVSTTPKGEAEPLGR